MPETDPVSERLDDAPAAIEAIQIEPAAASGPGEPEVAAAASSLEDGIASVFAAILAEDPPAEASAPVDADDDDADDALWALDAPLVLAGDDADEATPADAEDDASGDGTVTPLRRPTEEIPPEIQQIHELLTELDRLWSHAA